MSEELEKLQSLVTNPTEPEMDKSKIGMLCVKTANQWREEAAMRPDPNKLWMSLWYEGEVCCLFADSNLGKSIYAVQIANKIAETQPVLYFDFELSDKQFQLRYSDDNGNFHKFPDNLKRAEIDPDAYSECVMDGSFEDNVVADIEQAALALEIKNLIIDNLTYVCNASEKGDAAALLMMNLMRLKKKHGWSILVLAHTPKRSMASPITQNDLAGSKKLFNFFDIVFAIGLSAKDTNLRYIKQLKVRAGAFEHDKDNVIVAEIVKENAFLHFNNIGYATEKEHLKEMSDNDQSELIEQAKQYQQQGKSQREIAKLLNISVGKVNKLLHL